MARLTQPRPALALVTLVAAGCQHAPKEGPPPAETYEIASAAPRALGALAAGTDDAPPGIRSPAPSGPEEVDPDEEDEEQDAGVPHPDAALEVPEELPL